MNTSVKESISKINEYAEIYHEFYYFSEQTQQLICSINTLIKENRQFSIKNPDIDNFSKVSAILLKCQRQSCTCFDMVNELSNSDLTHIVYASQEIDSKFKHVNKLLDITRTSLRLLIGQFKYITNLSPSSDNLKQLEMLEFKIENAQQIIELLKKSLYNMELFYNNTSRQSARKRSIQRSLTPIRLQSGLSLNTSIILENNLEDNSLNLNADLLQTDLINTSFQNTNTRKLYQIQALQYPKPLDQQEFEEMKEEVKFLKLKMKDLQQIVNFQNVSSIKNVLDNFQQEVQLRLSKIEEKLQI
ncbi:hypothetical protein SS50377_24069 [Spironucleus salmonicida]|uniref:Uncharacterized protein n=1 Tax=Spironucleus salmonicida TaxID=348837 RepID=V6LWP9_9EUKA|nr:hypothetical protein SS50377_24069 [Spironucleus salmonicida]|eukprot:EST48141.1 Hypothetical protein SS50377_11702 [Spironucleus salmonicida]